MARQRVICACLLSIIFIGLESGFLAGECRLFQSKPIVLGRNLTERESKLFDDYWDVAQRYQYFEDSLHLMESAKSSGLRGNTGRRSQVDRSSSQYQNAVAVRKQELKGVFAQYLALREVYDLKKGSKDSVLKKWALVRLELEVCVSSLSDVIREIERALGVNSDIFAKVVFVENLATGELTPYIQKQGRSRFGRW